MVENTNMSGTNKESQTARYTLSDDEKHKIAEEVKRVTGSEKYFSRVRGKELLTSIAQKLNELDLQGLNVNIKDWYEDNFNGTGESYGAFSGKPEQHSVRQNILNLIKGWITDGMESNAFKELKIDTINIDNDEEFISLLEIFEENLAGIVPKWNKAYKELGYDTTPETSLSSFTSADLKRNETKIREIFAALKKVGETDSAMDAYGRYLNNVFANGTDEKAKEFITNLLNRLDPLQGLHDEISQLEDSNIDSVLDGILNFLKRTERSMQEINGFYQTTNVYTLSDDFRTDLDKFVLRYYGIVEQKEVLQNTDVNLIESLEERIEQYYQIHGFNLDIEAATGEDEATDPEQDLETNESPETAVDIEPVDEIAASHEATEETIDELFQEALEYMKSLGFNTSDLEKSYNSMRSDDVLNIDSKIYNIFTNLEDLVRVIDPNFDRTQLPFMFLTPWHEDPGPLAEANIRFMLKKIIELKKNDEDENNQSPELKETDEAADAFRIVDTILAPTTPSVDGEESRGDSGNGNGVENASVAPNGENSLDLVTVDQIPDSEVPSSKELNKTSKLVAEALAAASQKGELLIAIVKELVGGKLKVESKHDPESAELVSKEKKKRRLKLFRRAIDPTENSLEIDESARPERQVVLNHNASPLPDDVLDMIRELHSEGIISESDILRLREQGAYIDPYDEFVARVKESNGEKDFSQLFQISHRFKSYAYPEYINTVYDQLKKDENSLISEEVKDKIRNIFRYGLKIDKSKENTFREPNKIEIAQAKIAKLLYKAKLKEFRRAPMAFGLGVAMLYPLDLIAPQYISNIRHNGFENTVPPTNVDLYSGLALGLTAAYTPKILRKYSERLRKSLPLITTGRDSIIQTLNKLGSELYMLDNEKQHPVLIDNYQQRIRNLINESIQIVNADLQELFKEIEPHVLDLNKDAFKLPVAYARIEDIKTDIDKIRNVSWKEKTSLTLRNEFNLKINSILDSMSLKSRGDQIRVIRRDIEIINGINTSIGSNIDSIKERKIYEYMQSIEPHLTTFRRFKAFRSGVTFGIVLKALSLQV